MNLCNGLISDISDIYRTYIGHCNEMSISKKYINENGKITNKEQQEITGISKWTATDDLEELVNKGIFIKIGTRGQGTYYELKRADIGQNGQ